MKADNILKYAGPEDQIFNRAISDISVVLRETTLTFSDSIVIGSPVETEIVRVVSLGATEIAKIIHLKKKMTVRVVYLKDGPFEKICLLKGLLSLGHKKWRLRG